MIFGRGRRDIEMTVDAPDQPLAELMLAFGSIGWNCEFGAVKRAFGAEPLGLLRFTGASIGNLNQVLEGFEDLLSADDIGFDVRGSDREYVIFSRRYEPVLAAVAFYKSVVGAEHRRTLP